MTLIQAIGMCMPWWHPFTRSCLSKFEWVFSSSQNVPTCEYQNRILNKTRSLIWSGCIVKPTICFQDGPWCTSLRKLLYGYRLPRFRIRQGWVKTKVAFGIPVLGYSSYKPSTPSTELSHCFFNILICFLWMQKKTPIYQIHVYQQNCDGSASDDWEEDDMATGERNSG